MLVPIGVRVPLIEDSTGREAVNAGFRDGALWSHATSGIIERSRVLYHVLCSRSLNQARSLCPLSWSLCHSHQAWHNFAFLQTSILIFSLLFGFYIYSADLQAKQAHQFTPSPPLLLFFFFSCPCLGRIGICHVRVIVTLPIAVSSAERHWNRAG